MESFRVVLDKSNRLIDRALVLGVSLLLLGLVVSVGFYLATFDGGVSNDPNKWAAFGSFFGGVFSPLVSVVTLVALLKTIRLQQQTMLSQKSDSERVIELQNQAYKAQAEQLSMAEAELLSARITDFKSSVIRVFDQRISYYQHSQADALSRIGVIKSFGEFSGSMDAIELIADRGTLYKVELEKLLKFSLLFAIKDFNSLDEAKAFLAGFDTQAV
ncbi:hypothetical protein [Pseudomonas sp. GXZC]|uniref:hypothetical protein n=1 Tax=Pseudomonas sp. GXZC TaxID=3003351 RepID=UPI0022AA8B9E|nr:hypothetical protein [Pseudomonas sp. GXZC]WAT31782.1 hypothetical protein OZ428_15995 [Pseudomonas sp. GXZC]